MNLTQYISLIIRNVFFTLLQPGVVTILIPFLLVQNKWLDVYQSEWFWSQWVGIVLFILGWGILVFCIAQFITEGKGTLSPADPTLSLVVHGLYKYSRNPMYLGVLLILAGEALFFRSYLLLIYFSLVAIAFHVFILLREEPRLKREFGRAYEEYCLKVNRWV